MEYPRYFLRVENHLLGQIGSWQEVTVQKWCQAERAAGFRPMGGGINTPATAGFGGSGIRGRCAYSENSLPKEGFEPLTHHPDAFI